MSCSGKEPGGAFTRSSGSAVVPMTRGLKRGVVLASALVVDSALHAQGIVASTNVRCSVGKPWAPGMTEARL